MTPTIIEAQPPRTFPFWSYVDLAMFTAILAPCLAASLLVGALLLKVMGVAATWVAQLVLYGLLFAWLCLLLKVRYGQPFWESLGWNYPRRGLAICLVSGPLLAIMVNVLGALLHTPVLDLPIKKLLHGQLSLALFGLFSVIIGPITEELVFRGFLMPLLVRSFGRDLGILFTAIPFGLLHGSQYGWVWQYIVLVGMAGVIFGVARHVTGSTLASAALHSTYNLTMFVAFAVGGGGGM